MWLLGRPGIAVREHVAGWSLLGVVVEPVLVVLVLEAQLVELAVGEGEALVGVEAEAEVEEGAAVVAEEEGADVNMPRLKRTSN